MGVARRTNAIKHTHGKHSGHSNEGHHHEHHHHSGSSPPPAHASPGGHARSPDEGQILHPGADAPEEESSSPTGFFKKMKTQVLVLEEQGLGLGIGADKLINLDYDVFGGSENQLKDDVMEGGILTKGTRSQSEIEESPSGRAKHDFTQKNWFTGVIAVSILLNAIQMGIQTDHPQHVTLYRILENIWTAIFFVEMCSKFFFIRWKYFAEAWNRLDFLLVWLSVVEEWILPLVLQDADKGLRQLSILRMLRIMRTLRFIRLLKVFRELWVIVKGMISSVKTIFWASLLLIMVLYVSGIFCVQMVGKSDIYYNSKRDSPEWPVDYFPDWDAYQYYGTVPRAMFTLFEVCLEPLSLRPILEKQLWLGPFFMIFMFLTTFGVMNVIIGVIVENTAEASEEASQDLAELQKQEKVKKVECIRDACVLLDEDGDGFVTQDELKIGLQRPEISECLKDMQLPYGCDEEELFELLDSDGRGKITHGRMMTNLSRNIMHTDMQHMLELKGNMHHARRNLNGNTRKLTKLQQQADKLEKEYDKISKRIDQVELLSLELCRHQQDIVALLAGFPMKPKGCVDNILKKSREAREAREAASEKDHHAAKHEKESKIPRAPSLIPHPGGAGVVPKLQIPQKQPYEYEQGENTGHSKGSNSQVSSAERLSPEMPKVPYPPQSGSKDPFKPPSRSGSINKDPLPPRMGSKEPSGLPAMALASPGLSGMTPGLSGMAHSYEADDDQNVDNHSQVSTDRQSNRSKMSKVSMMSAGSMMSVPPALNRMLDVASYDGRDPLGRADTDSLFSFLPVPDGSHPFSSLQPPSSGRGPDKVHIEKLPPPSKAAQQQLQPAQLSLM